MNRKVYEVDPLRCPNSETSCRTAKRCPQCGGAMRVVAFLTEPAVVDRIIDHLKLTFVRPNGRLAADRIGRPAR
jgi:hypothetical protein